MSDQNWKDVLGERIPEDRSEDIERLAEFFLKRHAYEAKRPGVTLSPAARHALTHYPWPGNIRELDNVLSRAVVLSPSDVIEPDFLALSSDEATGKGGGDHALPYLNLAYHESMEAHSARSSNGRWNGRQAIKPRPLNFSIFSEHTSLG